MQINSVEQVLKTVYPEELVLYLLTSYENALIEFKKCNWQYTGNEMGQFIETSRRLIEYQLHGEFTSLTDKLSIFNEKALIIYENVPSKQEEYRIIIPRVLYSMYCIRNKRGMIHKNHIDPNKMDASLLLYNAKWVLAEFYRLVSTKTFEETEEIINGIMCKETSIVWDTGSTLRILDAKMSTKDKVLCLLYIKDSQTAEELQSSIEYSNSTTFKKQLWDLHKNRLIEYSLDKCYISPLGMEKAERLLR
ncbi:hypothetical protein [Tannockella kyphosi]|uniref:hypothetical protein n=1 Tax=Tannockella kyphosi TaxID=2899121 RepID=UPI0020131127|nr:hypothetical protein [Tannockella kyphosi]